VLTPDCFPIDSFSSFPLKAAAEVEIHHREELSLLERRIERLDAERTDERIKLNLKVSEEEMRVTVLNKQVWHW